MKLDLGPINIKFDISVAAPALAKKITQPMHLLERRPMSADARYSCPRNRCVQLPTFWIALAKGNPGESNAA